MSEEASLKKLKKDELIEKVLDAKKLEESLFKQGVRLKEERDIAYGNQRRAELVVAELYEAIRLYRAGTNPRHWTERERKLFQALPEGKP